MDMYYALMQPTLDTWDLIVSSGLLLEYNLQMSQILLVFLKYLLQIRWFIIPFFECLVCVWYVYNVHNNTSSMVYR